MINHLSGFSILILTLVIASLSIAFIARPDLGSQISVMITVLASLILAIIRTKRR